MARKTSKPSPVKKISTLVAFVGLLIGVIAGTVGLYKEFIQSRELKKEISTYIYIGDQFNEQHKYGRAIQEYEKVFDKDKEHEQAHRQIIATMRMEWQMAGVATNLEKLPKIDDILVRIYQLRAFHPELETDFDLLFEEARVLRYGYNKHFSNKYSALQILEKANKLYPETPEILAEMGLMQSMKAPKGEEDGINILFKVVEKHPDEFLYHFYLGRAYKHAEKKVSAIREFYQASKLASGKDQYSRKIHLDALNAAGNMLIDIFYQKNIGALTSQLNMPIEERLEILEYCMSNSRFSIWSSIAESEGFLATLYLEVGDYVRADSMMQKQMKKFYIHEHKIKNIRKEHIPWIQQHIKILQDGEVDSNRLAEKIVFYQAAKTELARREMKKLSNK